MRIAAGVVKLLVRNCSAALQLLDFGDRESAAASTARCSHVIQAALSRLDIQGVCVSGCGGVVWCVCVSVLRPS